MTDAHQSEERKFIPWLGSGIALEVLSAAEVPRTYFMNGDETS